MKLLVTTDFSTNSKGAIRFAQTLANQADNVEIVFYHALTIMKPTRWNERFYHSYEEEEIKRLTAELRKFVFSVLKDKERFDAVKCVVDNCLSTESGIIKFAQKNKMDYICIATQGAGLFRKVMGTHTSYIVNNSDVPVLVIPSHYRSKTLKRATYLSDFENIKSELTKISKLTTTAAMQLEVLHYSSILFDKKKFEKNKALFNTTALENIKLNIQKNNLEFSLVEKITAYVQKSKPELLIMFTNRKKGFFESIFLPSKSAELTYTTKVPVLIYSK
jgi:nucleotide-binding universal stress UspA family protein